MKTKIKITALLLVCLSSSAVFAQKDLEVTIKNIKETTGTIRVGLFNSEKDFLKNAIEGKVVKASATEVTVTFTNLKPGDYAVSVIHDKNENGELDSNFMGIPNEPYGFSNNAMGSFGPPSFEKAKLAADSNKAVINLK
jgi:uncharacterized protein (DUF2141 family)